MDDFFIDDDLVASGSDIEVFGESDISDSSEEAVLDSREIYEDAELSRAYS